jgi:hypothetical protein
MGFNLLKKLFDPNYATRRVEAVRKDSNQKLKRASNSADKLTEITKDKDVIMVIYTAVGGKR